MASVWDERLAVPVDPIRGIVNNVFDGIGWWRPEEFIPLPAELLMEVGFPTLKQFAVSPKEGADAFVGGTIPKMPRIPTFRDMVLPALSNAKLPALPTPPQLPGLPELPRMY